MASVTQGHRCTMPTLLSSPFGISYPIPSLLLNHIGKSAKSSRYYWGFLARYWPDTTHGKVGIGYLRTLVPDANLTIKSVQYWVPDSIFTIESYHHRLTSVTEYPSLYNNNVTKTTTQPQYNKSWKLSWDQSFPKV